MVGASVFLVDAEEIQLVLERVAAATDSGGEDEPVIGQGRRWWPVFADIVAEVGQHDWAGGDVVGGGGESGPGVVVEEGEYLDPGARRESPVGEVGLPDSVRQLGFETQIAGTRTLLRLLDDEPAASEDLPDRRWCRTGVVGAGEACGDGVGSGALARRARLGVFCQL